MKSIKEQIEERAENLIDYKSGIGMVAAREFKNGATFALELANTWTSVEDELPDEDIPVVVKALYSDQKEDYDVVRRVKSKDKNTAIDWHWSSIGFRSYYALKVTHWRYLNHSL